MTLPQEVARLIETFERNIESYRQGRYNETQVRREFVDPFFKALGWDMDNERGYAEAYKDVIHEDAIRVGAGTRAPDYCFRIGGTRKFFLEAKKPSVNIKDDPSPAYQLRRYAWSAKLPLSILTDFEEFAVYDCRVRPYQTDKPSKARLMYFKYTEYPEQWDEIASIFSLDAVLKGSFDKYAQTDKRKRGTAEVDAAFLAEIETWRDTLARNIALRNADLSNRQLNFAVQRTIDRIVFLRICEDRGIERYGQLQGLTNGIDIYQRLVALYRRADDRYNSGLFHFMREKGRPEGPDELTPELIIDDKVLKDILRSLYYPDSPYEFSVLPAEILGHVYEQFLGKVITLTPGHRAKVEDKPEVKKAGGVYYTPAYIVDYIVEHTVGKLLEGATVKAFKTRPPRLDRSLRVLDPACGSGSFLLGAYQALLDWYRDYYENHDPKQWAASKHPPIYQAGAKGWKLTTAERKRILLDHIYGVDIDTQAVEVTKLSLLLKVLEGETNLVLFHEERALPDLASNIKCGNSLIGPDFYDGQQFTMFDAEERLRINAFDWQAEFPDIFKDGGFDAVIGNPPYIRIQILKDSQPESIPYFTKHYQAAAKGNYDIYVIFVEQALNLINSKGLMGYILPHKFFNARYGEPLRRLVTDGKHLCHVVHFTHHQVFEGATTYTCLMFLNKRAIHACEVCHVHDLLAWQLDRVARQGTVPLAYLSSSEWVFVSDKAQGVKEAIESKGVPLRDFASRIFQGIKTGADPVFILSTAGDGTFYSKALDDEVRLESALLRPLFKSGDLKRYRLVENTRMVIFPYSEGVLVPWKQIEAEAPLTAKYLLRCKGILDTREKGRWADDSWYRYSRHQALEVISRRKILTADLNPSANYCLDATGTVCFTGGAAGGYGILVPEEFLLFTLGLLNSRLLDWYLMQISSQFRGGWFSYESRFISQLPVCVPEAGCYERNSTGTRIGELAEGMSTLHKSLSSAKTPEEQTAIQRQIDATDKQIDQLVYELYGLTDAEIEIVEQATC